MTLHERRQIPLRYITSLATDSPWRPEEQQRIGLDFPPQKIAPGLPFYGASDGVTPQTPEAIFHKYQRTPRGPVGDGDTDQRFYDPPQTFPSTVAQFVEENFEWRGFVDINESWTGFWMRFPDHLRVPVNVDNIQHLMSMHDALELYATTCFTPWWRAATGKPKGTFDSEGLPEYESWWPHEGDVADQHAHPDWTTPRDAPKFGWHSYSNPNLAVSVNFRGLDRLPEIQPRLRYNATYLRSRERMYTNIPDAQLANEFDEYVPSATYPATENLGLSRASDQWTDARTAEWRDQVQLDYLRAYRIWTALTWDALAVFLHYYRRYPLVAKSTVGILTYNAYQTIERTQAAVSYLRGYEAINLASYVEFQGPETYNAPAREERTEPVDLDYDGYNDADPPIWRTDHELFIVTNPRTLDNPLALHPNEDERWGFKQPTLPLATDPHEFTDAQEPDQFYSTWWPHNVNNGGFARTGEARIRHITYREPVFAEMLPETIEQRDVRPGQYDQYIRLEIRTRLPYMDPTDLVGHRMMIVDEPGEWVVESFRHIHDVNYLIILRQEETVYSLPAFEPEPLPEEMDDITHMLDTPPSFAPDNYGGPDENPY